MAFPGSVYAPPGVYTQTLYEDPIQGLAGTVRLPLIIGTGSEQLFQSALELVRGSSSSVDQRVVQEDETGRAVVSVSDTGVVTRGSFNGELTRLQTKHYPIVSGQGTGTTATDSASVNVVINGSPVVVLAIEGATGILTLSVTPKSTDEVKVTYYYNRTDTLITDTLSEQITPDAPEIIGALGGNYVVITGVNDTLAFTVDSVSTVSVTLSASSSAGWTTAQVATFINAAATGTTLAASTIINNFGNTVLRLIADRDIVIGSGTANTLLGLTAAYGTGRNKVFYTFQSPIVDGSDGGVTTTDPADVTVKVGGTQVIPTAVDGKTGAVTLPFAPEVGTTVTCQYYFNHWQDTYDYLAHRGITGITLCGLTPDRSDYTDGTDFILKDDKILWGTSTLTAAGTYTAGSTYFNDTQIGTSLVDTRQYLGACTAVASTSNKGFKLPLQPTTGNGRDTPLGATTFAEVANGRLDLPTDRPDLVYAYWGYTVEDALDRGRVEVIRVDSESSTLTLREPVPTGATVYATFYYNTLVDMAYTITSATEGASGVGTYTIMDENSVSLLTPEFGTKSALLSTVTVQFPSGSERSPDCRFESPFTTTSFTGAVEEDVTFTFAVQDATLAKYAVASAGPYYPVTGASDNLLITLDGTDRTIDLNNPDRSTAAVFPFANPKGFRASLVGDEIVYDAAGFATGVLTVTGVPAAGVATITVDGTVLTEGVGWTNGGDIDATATAIAGGITTFVASVSAVAIGSTVQVTAATAGTAANTIDTTETDPALAWGAVTLTGGTILGTAVALTSATNAISMELDGGLGLNPKEISAQVNTGAGQKAEHIVGAINRAAFGEFGAALGGSATTIILAADASDVDDYYVDWEVKVTAGLASGEKMTVTAYNGTTKAATVAAWAGGAPVITDTYYVYDPDTCPSFTGATRFANAVTLSVGFDDILLSYVGSTTGTTAITTTAVPIAAATYNTAGDLVTAVQTAMDAAILAAGFAVDTLEIDVSADTSARLVLLLKQHPTDTAGGMLQVVANATPADDFMVLSGFDLDTVGGDQTALMSVPIATEVTNLTATTTGVTPYDRIWVRNRICPGNLQTVTHLTDSKFFLDQCQLKMMGGTGSGIAGLTANEEGCAGITGTMQPPTLFGEVGLAGGQDATDDVLVELFAASGTTPQNNQFKMMFEGADVTLTFTDGAGAAIAPGASADVPLGPLSDANSIIGQIDAAMTTALVTGSVSQEGCGIRLRGGTSAAAATIVIGTANANTVLGFNDGDVAFRTVVDTDVLVSAVMAAFANWTDVGGIAKTIVDAVNAKYLYIQSMGTAGLGTLSSVIFGAAATDSALRPGVGLGVEAGEGNSGEAAIDGFFVTSTDTISGSGTANTSGLNGGVGQDGNVGETYRDLITGFTLTLLPRSGGGTYPTGGSVTFTVRAAVTTDSNLPVNTIPGVEMTVSNTSGVPAGDTSVVSTYEKGGNQPSVGDVYYVSYDYAKQDFSPALYTKLSSIQAAYGANSPNNPVSLASYFAVLNGAVLLAIKQVQKDTDSTSDGTYDTASEAAFITAIDSVEGTLPGGLYPDMLVPLKGDSTSFFQYVAMHCDIQSSIRYRAERTAICGYSAGTQPRDAGTIAQAVGRSRLRLLYPDIATLSLSRADGTTDTYLVDGTYVAAAWAGNRASPNIDVATPWTRGRIFGFDELARTLDAVQQNQVAVRGVTVFGQRQSIIECRHGLSTDMTNVLTKTPTVVTIADEVQRQARATLDKFIGTKFLPSVTGQIEGQLSNTLKKLVQASIIAAFTGVSAGVSPEDPTVAEVEAYYQPIFPLLYIVVTFNLRSSL